MSSASSAPPPPLTAEVSHDETYDYEQTHVHDVYNKIASHFSETRHKPWPVVDSFLHALSPGSIGLDVGCGNGKYLTVRKDIYIVASDRSSELVRIASQHEPHSTLVADTLSLPHQEGRFDFAICIAVIHHLSTRGRRVEALRHILELLRQPQRKDSNREMQYGREDAASGYGEKCGEALIFVWALEQKNSRRGWDEGHEQDVLVPWVLKANSNRSKARPRSIESLDPEASALMTGAETVPPTDDEKTNIMPPPAPSPPTTYQRYYHLYRRGEVEEDIVTAGGEVVQSGYDRDNWWCIARRKPDV